VNKKIVQIVSVLLLIWVFCPITTANANLYNFGTLDIRPVSQTENKEWFIEYLNPGEQKQEQIQISNFAKETKKLTIYVTDTSVNKNSQFYTKSYEENSGYTAEGSENTRREVTIRSAEGPEDTRREGIKEWITLPSDEITLNSGESKILSVNFQIPKNAGVGLHTGAIIVRENKTDMVIEKGTRIYLNITGTAITKGEITNIKTSETISKYILNVQTQNYGTTDFTDTYKLELKSIFGKTHSQIIKEEKVKPQTVSTATLSIEKPKYGLFNVVLSTQEKETYIKTIVFIPFWIPLTLLILLFIVSKFKYPKLKYKNLFTFTPELKKGITYICILTIVSTFILTTQIKGEEANAKIARGQTIKEFKAKETIAASYELTIKWGSFRDTFYPYGIKKEWHGRIFSPNAKITIIDLLNFEENDKAELIGDKTSLRFDTITEKDNDGITLLVEPTTDVIPTINYENYENNNEYQFLITDFINSAGIYPDGIHATYFRAEFSEQEKLRQKAIELSTLSELEAAKELEAVSRQAVDIPELENLFVEDFPATTEALTDLILSSNYVENIVEENKVSKIETDSILISALQGTPEVLQELMSTPELNFIFIPSETINFPAQEFSYKLDKNSEQNLGTIIFIQNKNTPWNTFISATDFELLSGDTIIPASALTIDPGKPIILSKEDGALITEGKAKKLTSKTEKIPLVEVKPKTNKQEVFIMNPKLTVSIPRGTPAGTYRGQLIITSL
jgi:hypothetical protein